MAADPEELANFVASRMREDPKVAAVVNEAHMLDGLREHAGWRRLAERVRASEKGWMESLARRLMRGDKIPSEEIDFHRGFYSGARWIIEHPEQAEAALEQAAQEAWKLVRREALLQQERDDSPYLIRPIDSQEEEGNAGHPERTE